MKTLLIQILCTCLLTSCAGYQFGDATKLAIEVSEAVEEDRQNKCDRDISQCEKYGKEQVRKKRICSYWIREDCHTKFSGGNK